MVTSPLLLTELMLMLMNLMLNVKLLPTATPFTWFEKVHSEKGLLEKARGSFKNLGRKGDIVKPRIASTVHIPDFLLLNLPLRKTLRRNPLPVRSLERPKIIISL